jgi:hypothetical protein
MRRTAGLVSLLPLAAVVVLYGSSLVSAQADPLLGTWTMDASKSKYDPGPAPKSSTAMFAAAGTGVKVTVDGVSASGEKSHWEYTAQYDGKDVAVTGNPDADMIAMTRISPRVTQTIYKKGGKATLTNRRTVSADGKTLTVTQTGTNAQGQKVNNTLVYTKG